MWWNAATVPARARNPLGRTSRTTLSDASLRQFSNDDLRPIGFAYEHHECSHSQYFTMRQTLRRSCDSCARSKLSCDLRTPQCSRCLKRNSLCVYANQPLSVSPDEHSPPAVSTALEVTSYMEKTSLLCNQSIDRSFDPFDSFPRTRLARTHVQRLIRHCTSFQKPWLQFARARR